VRGRSVASFHREKEKTPPRGGGGGAFLD